MHHFWLKLFLFICYGFVVTSLIGCKKDVANETVVYNNNFENADLTNISNGAIDVFNGGHVLGRYFNGYFQLKVNDLPTHTMATISFDLYIHDSWDGNANYGNNYVGPDIWQMQIDSNTYINTTFSNLGCNIGFICPPQSYPQTYPGTNNPRTGSVLNLPGACLLKANTDGTSLYKIMRTIPHTNSSIVLKCLDQLKEMGTADPKCAESWSVDNIKITVLR